MQSASVENEGRTQLLFNELQTQIRLLRYCTLMVLLLYRVMS